MARRLFANIYLAATIVAKSLPEFGNVTPQPLGLLAPEDPTIKLLTRLSGMSRFVFPAESWAHMPVFDFDPQTNRMLVGKCGGECIPPVGRVQVVAHSFGDGYTRPFYFSYGKAVAQGILTDADA
jgi:hypothetical protein